MKHDPIALTIGDHTALTTFPGVKFNEFVPVFVYETISGKKVAETDILLPYRDGDAACIAHIEREQRRMIAGVTG